MQKSVDRSGITTTIKYAFGDPSLVLISPLVGYRQIYGLSDYADAGVNVSYLQFWICQCFITAIKVLQVGLALITMRYLSSHVFITQNLQRYGAYQAVHLNSHWVCLFLFVKISDQPQKASNSGSLMRISPYVPSDL